MKYRREFNTQTNIEKYTFTNRKLTVNIWGQYKHIYYPDHEYLVTECILTITMQNGTCIIQYLYFTQNTQLHWAENKKKHREVALNILPLVYTTKLNSSPVAGICSGPACVVLGLAYTCWNEPPLASAALFCRILALWAFALNVKYMYSSSKWHIKIDLIIDFSILDCVDSS